MSTCDSCDRCGLPATYPGAALDAMGRCALCRAAGDRTWPSPGDDALWGLLDPVVRDARAPYVCLVSYSGGKDSTYMLARLAARYPGRILAFTYDTSTMSPHVWTNIHRVVERLGVTWVRFSPPAELMKRVFRGALESLVPLQTKKTIYARGTVEFGPLCYACGTLYNLMAIRTAAIYEAPFVAMGFTPAQDSTHYPLTHRFLSKPSELHADVHAGRRGGLPASDYVKMAEPMLRLLESATGSASERDMLPFRLRPSDALERLRVLRFYDYVAYDETTVREGAIAVGFEPPPDTGYGSTNCQLNPLIRHVYASMYGADKYIAQDAALVRWGFGNRQDVLRRATPLPTTEEVAPLFARIGTTAESFEALVTSRTKT